MEIFIVIIFVALILTFVTGMRKRNNDEDRITLMNTIQNLHNLEDYYIKAKESLKSNPNQPFVKSTFDQLSIKIEIEKIKIGILNGSLSEEEAQIMMNKAMKDLAYYFYLDRNYNNDYRDPYNKLIMVISKASSISWANKIPTPHKNHYMGNDILREKTAFLKKFFNKVVTSFEIGVYAIKCNDITYYFYPECLVEAKSNFDYKILKYSEVLFEKEKIKIEEEINDKFGTNPMFGYYYYLYSRDLSNFILEITNEQFANDLFDALRNMAKDAHYNVEDTSEEDHLSLEYNDELFIKAMRSIYEAYGKDVFLENRFIYMLDDYKVFKDIPYLKNVLKIMQVEGKLKDIIVQDSWNNKCMATVATLSHKYMLQEQAIERVLKDIMMAINE